MAKIKWELFKRTYPFTCDSCNELHWEKRAICEGCGKTHTIRKVKKKDYRKWKKK